MAYVSLATQWGLMPPQKTFSSETYKQPKGRGIRPLTRYARNKKHFCDYLSAIDQDVVYKAVNDRGSYKSRNRLLWALSDVAEHKSRDEVSYFAYEFANMSDKEVEIVAPVISKAVGKYNLGIAKTIVETPRHYGFKKTKKLMDMFRSLIDDGKDAQLFDAIRNTDYLSDIFKGHGF